MLADVLTAGGAPMGFILGTLMYQQIKLLVRVIAWVAMTGAIGACASVSYDQQADQQITGVTQEITLQLLTWANQAAEGKTPVTYDAAFYNKAEADIATLRIRMEASQDPATAKLATIFSSLNDQLETLRSLHQKQNNLSATFLRAELDLLNVQLATLTTFELSLKGTQSSGSSNAKTSSTSTDTTKQKAQTSKAADVVASAKGSS
jgi:hypothetical protein